MFGKKGKQRHKEANWNGGNEKTKTITNTKTRTVKTGYQGGKNSDGDSWKRKYREKENDNAQTPQSIHSENRESSGLIKKVLIGGVILAGLSTGAAYLTMRYPNKIESVKNHLKNTYSEITISKDADWHTKAEQKALYDKIKETSINTVTANRGDSVWRYWKADNRGLTWKKYSEQFIIDNGLKTSRIVAGKGYQLPRRR